MYFYRLGIYPYCLARIMCTLILLGIIFTISSCGTVPIILQLNLSPLESPNGEPASTLNQPLSTPVLIQKAFEKGEITAGERILYLTYAIYEYGSLPVQFRSNVGWRGTAVVEEIHEAINSPTMCSFGMQIQKELQRLLHVGVICENR